MSINRQLVKAVEYGVVGVILWSIKANGLEKTLEDLRNACGIYGPKPDKKIYVSFLESLEEMNDVMKLGTKVNEQKDES